MKTKTVGEVLRAERESRRVSLEWLAGKSRIRENLLTALEDNRFDELPAAVFVKSYIRAYGRLLGFDHVPVVALLRRDFRESARGQLVPREFLKPALRRQPWLTPVRLAVFTLGMIFVVVFGYLSLQWRAVTQPPTLVVTQPTESAVVAAKLVVKGLTNPESIVLVNDQPVALQADGSFATEIVLPTEGLATLKITATDRKGKQTIKERTVMVKY